MSTPDPPKNPPPQEAPHDPPPQQPWRIPPRTASPDPTAPPVPGAPPPPPGPAYAPPGGAVDIRVTKRLLWVGQAVYPLANITRVHTSTYQPNRWRAFVTCAKVIGYTLPVAFVISLLADGSTKFGSGARGDEASTVIELTWATAAVIAAFAIIRFLAVAFAPSYPILVIETNGVPAALLPGTDRAALHQITLQISRSLENPEIELTMRVQTLTIGNTSNYHYGDTVNMFGGDGNTGVSR